jgi:hypothetical protein
LWVTGEYYDALRDVETAARGRLGEVQPEPYSRLDWFKRSWSCEPAGPRPLVVRTRVSGAEAWLFLARQHPKRLAPLAGPHSLRFAPIFTGDPGADVQRTLLRAAARRLRMFSVARISLSPLLPEHAAMLRISFARAGWIVAERPGPANYLISVADRSFDDYWESRQDQLHEQIAASSRHLEIEIADLLSPRLWDEVQLLAGDDRFLRELAQDATLDRTLRLAVARVGDAPVAAQLWTSERGRAWCHWRAEDADARHMFPSAQLNASMLRYLMNVDHAETIDLGNGSEADLAGWADERRVLRRLALFNPGAPSAWLPALGAKIAGLVGRSRLD